MSVIEMSVTLGILSLVLVILLTFLNQVMAVTVRSENDSLLERNGQLALRTVTEDLRGMSQTTLTQCPPSGQPSWPTSLDNCATFRVYHDNSNVTTCPYSVITYALYQGALMEQRQDYALVSGACSSTPTTSTRTVLTSVANSSAQPLFTYYDNTGASISTSSPPAGGVGGSVHSISVWLAVTYTGGSSQVSLKSIAALRNADTR